MGRPAWAPLHRRAGRPRSGGSFDLAVCSWGAAGNDLVRVRLSQPGVQLRAARGALAAAHPACLWALSDTGTLCAPPCLQRWTSGARALPKPSLHPVCEGFATDLPDCRQGHH